MKNKITYIIDDDKLSIKLMSMLILKNEFCKEIISFFNPQTALQDLKNNAADASKLPDVILLDLNMPVLDGWQFLDEFMLLPIQKEIAIFIVTSSIDPADIEMTKKYKVVKNYLMKPITAKKLEEATKSI
ncbi:MULTISPECIES: response regulator [unclassified Flavobacterium]|uniref:response regulator n=1 Tax=unclassified Flavobacterium TaxID=196869 RepID=UPI003F91F0DA